MTNTRYLATATILTLAALPTAMTAQEGKAVPRHPLHFEQIQDAEPAAYIARNASLAVIVDGEGLLIRLPDGREIRCTVVGGLPGVAEPRRRTGGTSSYYLESDPASWRESIPHFAEVCLRGVLPGVDVVCYPAGAHLEFDLELAPHVDPATVRLRLQGVEGLRAAGDGAIEVPVGEDTLRLRTPIAFQRDPVDGSRREIPSRYRIDAASGPDSVEIGFEIGAHDATRPLVIDPIIEFSTLLGGSHDDDVSDVAYDQVTGETVLVGRTRSSDFPLVAPLPQQYTGLHAFVSRFDAAGTLLHSTFLGTGVSSIYVDTDVYGNADVAGHTIGGHPVTASALQPTRVGGNDWFVTEIGINGQLLWSTYAGGSGDDAVVGVEVGVSDYVFVAGHSTGGFPTTPGAYSRITSGPIVAAIDSGLRYQFSTDLAFTGNISALALDTYSGVWVTGTTTANDMPTPANAFMTGNPGQGSGFVFGLTSDGSSRVVSSYYGGTGWDQPADLFVRFDRNLAALYVTIAGQTTSTDLPTANALQQAYGGGFHDSFLAQFSHNLGGLRFSTYFGGNLQDSLFRIAEDADHNILMAGWAASKDLPMDDAFQGPAYQGPSGYLVRLLPTGDTIDYATYFGGRFAGTNIDVTGLAVQPSGEAIVAGSTRNAEWYTTPNAIRSAFQGLRGSTDAFLIRFSSTTVQSYGQGTGDFYGIVPVLSAAGDLTPGSTVKLRIQDGRGGEFGLLALGFGGRVGVPLFGGTLLVAPVWTMPMTLNGGANNQWGHWGTDMQIPAGGTLSGLSIQAQAVLGSPVSATFTQGIELTLR